MRRRLALVGSLFLLVALAGSLLAVMSHAASEENAAVARIEFNAVQMESDHFALRWNVAASGGGQLDSPHFHLSSTLGQPVIGNFSSPNFRHRAGYWQEWLYRLFLPLIQRT